MLHEANILTFTCQVGRVLIELIAIIDRSTINVEFAVDHCRLMCEATTKVWYWVFVHLIGLVRSGTESGEDEDDAQSYATHDRFQGGLLVQDHMVTFTE